MEILQTMQKTYKNLTAEDLSMDLLFSIKVQSVWDQVGFINWLIAVTFSVNF